MHKEAVTAPKVLTVPRAQNTDHALEDRLQGRVMHPAALPTRDTPWLLRHLPHAASASTATASASGFIAATATVVTAAAAAPAAAPSVLLASPVATATALVLTAVTAAATTHRGLVLAIAPCQEGEKHALKDKLQSGI